MQKGKFFSYSWHVDNKETDYTLIRIYGLNEHNENTCLVVKNFKPYVYIELSENIDWHEGNAMLVVTKLDSLMGRIKPYDVKLVFKKRLYFANLHDGKHRYYPYLRCEFNHSDDIRKLSWKIKRPFLIPGVGPVQLKMYENNAKPVLQLTSLQQLPTAGWMIFKGKKVDPEEQMTHCQHEYIVKWDHMQILKVKEGELLPPARPLILSYDIECNSSIPSKMPDAEKPEDKVFQISCVFARQNSDDYDNYLLTLGKPDFKTLGEDIGVLMYDTEYELLMGFVELLHQKQPNIIVGYNIFGFDIPYMLQRAQDSGCYFEFTKQGMNKYGCAERKEINWSSSAFKNQNFVVLDAEGRIFFDLLPYVKRNYKFANYKLKTIAAHFLDGITKDPLDAKGIFKCYRLGMKGGKKGARALSLVGKYCVKDSALVLKLFEVLTTWIALTEMSKVTNVQIFSLYTQGEQLKVFSQVYRDCTHNDVVVEKDRYIPGPDDHYIGATVFPPVPGVYDKVLPFDFCLTGDTLINMGDGRSKRLDSLTEETSVIGYHEKQLSIFPMIDGVECKGKKDTVKIYLQNNETLTATPDHMVLLSNGEWCRADQLKNRYVMSGIKYPEKGTGKISTPDLRVFKQKVIDIRPNGEQLVYDIQVEKAHNFIANGIVVSNCSLYPTTIIAYNISWDTFVPADSKIPDEDCHVMEWSDHYGCLCDPKEIRKAKLNTIIKKGDLELKELRRLRDLKSNKDRKEEYKEAIAKKIEEMRPYREERSQLQKTKGKHVICCERRFRWLKKPQGIMPKILSNLLEARARDKKALKIAKGELSDLKGKKTIVEAELKEAKKSQKKLLQKEIEKLAGLISEKQTRVEVLNQRQLALKLSANSGYGAFGVKRGYLPLMPAAMCTTYRGRMAVQLAAEVVQQPKYGGKLIYGDSIAGNTPIMVRYDNGGIDIRRIDSLSRKWTEYDEFRSEDSNRSEKQQCLVDCEIWTGKWSKIIRVIRHKTNKKMYRVTTGMGMVDVTEDHSLLTENKKAIKPIEVKVGQTLLHSFPESFDEFSVDMVEGVGNTVTGRKEVDEKDAILWAKLLKLPMDQSAIRKKHIKILSENGVKHVPYAILNAPQQLKKLFVMMYDSDMWVHSIWRFVNDSLLAQGFYVLLRSLGYDIEMTVEYPEHLGGKQSVIYLTEVHKKINRDSCCSLFSRKQEKNSMKEIKDVKYLKMIREGYVYDIETEEGIFQAGVGCMILKNTDSNYVSFPHLNTAQECWDHAEKVAKKISKLYPKPMNLAFEEKIYWRFFIITKKRYMSLACERDGILERDSKGNLKINKKGVLLQRRDNCNFIRKVYAGIIMMIFNSVPREDVLYQIIQDLNNLCAHYYNSSDFVITKAVGDCGDLVPQAAIDDKNNPCYKVGDYKVKKLPVDKEARDHQYKLKNCNTPKEYYLKCLPAQVQLAERMRRRGQLVAAGSRLEYVITTNGGHTAKQYDKVESAEYFVKHSGSLELDYMYYMKQLANPMDQVLNIMFNNDKGKYKYQRDFVLNQYKYRLRIRGKVMTELKEIFAPKIKIIDEPKRRVRKNEQL